MGASENNNTLSAKSKNKSNKVENQKPLNGTKLDISKFRSLVERNTLDNDRLKQKAEARKSDSRLEPEQEKKLNNNEKMDNVKHHKEGEANKPDNYQHVETEN